MFVLSIDATLPTTLWGWAAVLGTIVSTILLVGAVITRTARAHINRRIELTLEDKTRDTVEECLKPIDVKIDGLRLNQTQGTTATLSAIKRIEDLEVTINNGLTHSTIQTKEDVEDLKRTVGAMQIQLSEMHGWMKAALPKPT